MKNLTTILSLIVIIAVFTVVFTIQNADLVDVSFLAWQFETPLALVVIASLALGSLLTLLSTIPGRWKKRTEIATYKHKIKELEATLTETKKTEMPTPNPTPTAEEQTDTSDTENTP